MKGSLARARVLYAPVEEIGSENRLLRACRILNILAYEFFINVIALKDNEDDFYPLFI